MKRYIYNSRRSSNYDIEFDLANGMDIDTISVESELIPRLREFSDIIEYICIDPGSISFEFRYRDIPIYLTLQYKDTPIYEPGYDWNRLTDILRTIPEFHSSVEDYWESVQSLKLLDWSAKLTCTIDFHTRLKSLFIVSNDSNFNHVLDKINEVLHDYISDEYLPTEFNPEGMPILRGRMVMCSMKPEKVEAKKKFVDQIVNKICKGTASIAEIDRACESVVWLWKWKHIDDETKNLLCDKLTNAMNGVDDEILPDWDD